MATAATVIGVSLGAFQGIEAAYLGGRTDTMIMRGMDVFLAFPGNRPRSADRRDRRAQALAHRARRRSRARAPGGPRHAGGRARRRRSVTIVKAVELQGVKPTRIITGEILPNLVSPLMVELGLRLTYSIVIIAGLSFLGFGQQPPAPSWGNMISENRIGLQTNPWAVIVPAALIALLAIGTNLFADAVARAAIGADRQVEQAFVRTEAAKARPMNVAANAPDRDLRSEASRCAWRGRRPMSSRRSTSRWHPEKCSALSANRARGRRRSPSLCSATPGAACTSPAARFSSTDRRSSDIPERELPALRGGRVAYVPQEPAAALNPVRRVGKQIDEILRVHEGRRLQGRRCRRARPRGARRGRPADRRRPSCAVSPTSSPAASSSESSSPWLSPADQG